MLHPATCSEYAWIMLPRSRTRCPTHAPMTNCSAHQSARVRRARRRPNPLKRGQLIGKELDPNLIPQVQSNNLKNKDIRYIEWCKTIVPAAQSDFFWLAELFNVPLPIDRMGANLSKGKTNTECSMMNSSSQEAWSRTAKCPTSQKQEAIGWQLCPRLEQCIKMLKAAFMDSWILLVSLFCESCRRNDQSSFPMTWL